MGENLEDLITKEVLVAHKRLQIGVRQDVTQHLEADGSDLVQTNIELLQFWCILESLSQQDHALITNDVALHIQVLKGDIALDSLG